MRSSLLSAVSHDLRTPLAAITGSATTLRDKGDVDPGARRELVDTICEEAERLGRLVSNVLDMTRLESGTVAVQREWVPLEELIGSALTRLEAELEGRAVSVSLPSDLPLVSVDPVLLEQALVNLLENAAKHTPSGTAIDVSAQHDGDLVVAVADRGPGVPEGDEERVFDKFYRGTAVRTSGVGLGLPICRAIAEAHGGSIVAQHRDEGGAVFRMRLPQHGAPPSVPLDVENRAEPR
jgi:two-component system sensor histidine kinase KdpD